MKTEDITLNIRPNLLSPSMLEIDDEIEKNKSGMTATNNKFKKMSPIGLMKGTTFGAYNPNRLPTIMPISNKIMLL